jgi:hypothetical protein
MELIEDVHVALMHGMCLDLRRMVRETAMQPAMA